MSRLPGVTPFPSEFAARYRARGYWEDIPVGSFYADVFASHNDRMALVSGDERITYSELGQRADRLALHLLGLGVRPLDRWVVQLPNIPEFVYLYFALERLGAIPIMALAGHRWNEINAFFELSEASGYAVGEKLGDFDSQQLITPLREAHPELRTVLTAIGEDRPGLVEEVSEFVFARGGSIENSRMANMQGQFAIVMVIGGTKQAIDRITSDLDTLSGEARSLQRVVYANAVEGDLDKQGRIVLPSALKEYAGIDRDVVVAGVNDHLEIWDRATWRRELAESEGRTRDVAERLAAQRD